MIPMIDPVTAALGVVIWMAFRKNTNQENYGVLTPERAEIYRNALEHLQDPVRMQQLAAKFYEFGLKIEASILRERGKWRARSEETKALHEQIYQKALHSENVQGILAVAAEFERMTATFKAKKLRERAKEVQRQEASKSNGVAAKAPPVEVKAEIVEDKQETT